MVLIKVKLHLLMREFLQEVHLH